MSQIEITITGGSFSIGNEFIDGTRALVAIVGDLCVHSDVEATTEMACTNNSNPNAGLPPASGSFSEDYAAASKGNGTETAPCIEVNGLWYVDVESLGGFSSSPTTVPTSTPTTTPSGYTTIP